MRALAVLRLAPGATVSAIAGQLDAEVAQLWRLYADGVVVDVHLTDDPTVVVLMVEAADRKGAEQALASLPLLQTGSMTAEVHPLLPFRNWERLFAHPPAAPTD